jgi:hypothetical protein
MTCSATHNTASQFTVRAHHTRAQGQEPPRRRSPHPLLRVRVVYETLALWRVNHAHNQKHVNRLLGNVAVHALPLPVPRGQSMDTHNEPVAGWGKHHRLELAMRKACQRQRARHRRHGKPLLVARVPRVHRVEQTHEPPTGPKQRKQSKQTIQKHAQSTDTPTHDTKQRQPLCLLTR